MADYKGLTITFEGDADRLSNVLHTIASSAKAAQGELTGIQNALRFDTNNVKLYGNQVKQTSVALKAAKDRQQAFADAIAKSKQRVADYTRDLERMRSAGMQDTTEYQATLQALQAEQEQLAKLEAEYEKAGGAVAQWQRALEQAINQEAIHTTALGRFGTAAIQAGEGLQVLGSHIEDLGRKLTILTPFQTMSILRGFEGAAEEFGNVMSQVGGYLDISGSELESMSGLALQWGKDTKYSAVEAGNAISELAKGGLSDAEIKGGALAATMELAAAGNISMASAANVAVQAIKTFGLEAGNSTAIADALAGAANKSTAEISDLSQGFVQVGGWARLAGWDINDTAGALALMADRGYTGAMAGTSLKVMLQRLAAPTDKAAKTMEELGIQVRNSDGSMKSSTEIVDQFTNAMSGLNDEERDTALQTIFGTRAINAMLALMQEGSGGLQAYIDATKRQGYAAEMAQAQLGDLGWAMELLRGEAETAAVNVGGVMTPALIDLARAAEGVLTAFNDADKGTQEFIVQMGLAGISVGPVLTIVGRMVGGLGGLFTTVGHTAQGIAAFSKHMERGSGVATAFGNAIETASGGAVEAGAAISTMKTALMGLGITAGIVALTAAFAYLVHLNREHAEQLKAIEDGQKSVSDSSSELSGALDRVAGGMSSVNEEIEDAEEAYSAADALDRLADANRNLSDTITQNNDSYLAQHDRLQQARDAIEQYAGKAGLTAEEQGKLKLAIDTMNDVLGTNYELVDAANGVIKQQGDDAEVTADKLQELIDKEMEMARTNALLSSLQSAYETYYQTQEEVAKATSAHTSAQNDMNAAIERRNELLAKPHKTFDEELELDSLRETGGEFKRLQENLDGTKTALDAATDSAKQQADTIDFLSDQYVNGQGALSDFENMLAILGEERAGRFKTALEEMGVSMDSFADISKQGTQDLLNFLVSQWDGSTEQLKAFIDELNGKEIERKTAEIDGDATGAEKAADEATTAVKKVPDWMMTLMKGNAVDVIDRAQRAAGAVKGVPQNWLTNFGGDASGVSRAAGIARAAIDSVARSVNTSFSGSGFGRAAGGIRTHADGGIRYHAGGSIVNVPKWGYPLDLVGEAGAEAIVPLTNRRYSQPFIDLLADGIEGRVGGTSYTLYINDAKVNDDQAIHDKFLDLMYELSRRAEMQRG